jgi:hypothetical protein
VPSGVITTERKVMAHNELPDFSKSNKAFGKVVLCEHGTIEDCIGAIQVISNLTKDQNKGISYFISI